MHLVPTGWVREFVQRLVKSTNFFDVYYHTPDGMKLRSSVEIKKYCELLHILVISTKQITM